MLNALLDPWRATTIEAQKDVKSQIGISSLLLLEMQDLLDYDWTVVAVEESL